MVLRRLLSVLLLALIASNCGSDDDDAELSFTDPDTSFEVEVGDRFEIVLESNATTGFGWALEVDPPRDVVRLVSDDYLAPEDTDLVGVGGAQRLTFEATGDGSTFLQLWYVRSFDDPPEPAERAQFEVIVGGGDPGGPVDPDEIDEPGSSIPDDEDAIDVTTLLDEQPEGEVVVSGLLFDDGGGLVLCGALAESFPPQCPGERLSIANPEVIDLELTEEGTVRWSDRGVLLWGRLTADGFEVVEATTR